jgi:FkbM family methyltransferase
MDKTSYNTHTDKNYFFTFEQTQEFEFIYNEIFRDNIYDVDVTNPKLIVDIGAHIGLATMYFRLKYSNSKILAFEPNPYAQKLFLENIDNNHLEKIELIPKAVTNKSGTRDFFIDTKDRWFSNSSLRNKGWDNHQEDLEKIEIDTISFKDILEMNPSIIKLDVEGIEQGLIKNNQENLGKCDFFIIEFHQNENQDLDKMLKIFSRAKFATKVEIDKLNPQLGIIYARNNNHNY